jgi:hypothetical protein
VPPAPRFLRVFCFCSVASLPFIACSPSDPISLLNERRVRGSHAGEAPLSIVMVIWSMWQAELVALVRHVGQIILAKFVVVLLCVGVGRGCAVWAVLGVRIYCVIWCVSVDWVGGWRLMRRSGRVV